MIDLRWWEDYSKWKAHEGIRFPSERALSARWKWSRRQVRTLLRERRREWEDESGPLPDHFRTTSGPSRNGRNSDIRKKRTTSGPLPDQERTTLTNYNSPIHRGSPRVHARARETNRSNDELELPLQGSETMQDNRTTSKASSTFREDPSPPWVKNWLSGDGRKLLEGSSLVEPLQVYGAVNTVLEEIRGRVRKPSESASRPVLRLWREALEVERASTLEDLVEVGTLLARACRDCPDPIFSNDVRGIRPDGETWKKDTSRTPSAVCRLAAPKDSSGASWEDRLDAAEKWSEDGEPEVEAKPNTRTTRPGRGRGRRSAADRLLEEL